MSNRLDKSDDSPYVGPRPFERKDQALFFGRDREALQIISMILSNPLVLIYSQSGVGKTSLFNARVFYDLEEQYNFIVFPPARVKNILAPDKVPEKLDNAYIYNALLSLAPEDDSNALNETTLFDFLNQYSKKDSENNSIPRVIIFDQLEELFSFYPENWYEQQQEFFRQIALALVADPTLRIVLIIREEYLAHLSPFANAVPGRMRARFRLERLSRDNALLAVTEPLKSTGRSFGSGVAEKLVEDLLTMKVENTLGKLVEISGKYAEPVQLQVVCKRLWLEITSSGMMQITNEHLEKFADIDKALTDFYVNVIHQAAKKTRTRETTIRRWFSERLITSSGTRSIVHRGSKFTAGIPNKVIDVLEYGYLIRPEWRSGARWYELTHDRLIEPIKESNKEWRFKRKIKKLISTSAMIASIFVIAVVIGHYNLYGNLSTSTGQGLEFPSIEVGTNPTGVTVNALSNMIYVTNTADNSTSVINGQTNEVLYYIPTGHSPTGIAVNPQTNRIYVTNTADNTISVINGQTNEVLVNVVVGSLPTGIAVNPQTNRIYVAASAAYILDGEINRVVRIVETDPLGGSQAVAIDPGHDRVYFANYYHNFITIINSLTNTEVNSINPNNSAGNLAINPNSNTLYTTNKNNNSLTWIDLSNIKLVQKRAEPP